MYITSTPSPLHTNGTVTFEFLQSPSQVWRLMVGAPGLMIGFTLLHSYIPQASTTFAALPSIFGGEHDEFVLRIATSKPHYDRFKITALST